MELNLKGKVAVVTGGGGVLGGSISRSLVENGVKVAILDIRQEQLDNRVKELKSLGEVMGIQCNVLDMQSLEAAREKLLAGWGSVDILVNAAGGNLPGATLREDQTVFDMKVEDFNRVTDLNMNGTVYPCLVFGKAMAEKGAGSREHYQCLVDGDLFGYNARAGLFRCQKRSEYLYPMAGYGDGFEVQ